MRRPFDEIFDELIRWYKEGGEAELPPDLKMHRLRWMQVRDYIMTHNPKHDGVVVSHFGLEWDVSEASAYHEVKLAKRFYAHCEPAVAEFDKIVLIAQIKELRKASMNAGKLAVAANCDKNLITLGAFDQPQALGEGGPTVIEVHMDHNPALVGAKRDANLLPQISKFIGEAKARRELLIADDVEDVDHEDVTGQNALPSQP